MRHEKEVKVYELFFENPDKRFTVREIESKTGVSKASAQRYLNKMRGNGLIGKQNEVTNNLIFRTIKTNYFMENIVTSGLVDEFIQTMNPSCIILFGSIRKGDSNKDSDIDIFVESHLDKIPSLKKFERKLKHRIDIFVKPDINKLQENLFNNVINGIKLYGSLNVK